MFENIIGPNRSATWVFNFWPILLTSFIAAFAATWLCKKIAVKYGIVDKPDKLVKTHKEPIAYLGGIGILVGLTVGLLTSITWLRNELFFDSILMQLIGILAGAAIACFVGLTDDIIDIKPLQKILGQAVAAVILMVVGIVPNLQPFTDFFNLSIPHEFELILQYLIVLFFVLGATNSLNLLDGLDGLCAGVTTIITVAFLLISIHLATWAFSQTGDPIRIVVCLSLVGGACGFLPFNRHPAKIFMGDAGSMLLGFCVAALMMLFAEQIPRWWFASTVVFGLPILDTATALLRRLINKRPLFVSDRGHIYDQMIDRGISLRKTVVVCYFLTALFAVFGIGMAVTTAIRTKHAVFIYALVFIISGLIIWKKGYLKMEGLRGKIPEKK